MADRPNPPASPLLAGYTPVKGVADELFDATGRMRPVWRRFVERFLRLSPEEIEARFERADLYLRDAGVFYRQYSNDPLTERSWPLSHIPVILHEAEWRGICEGLTQRADLLEQVMADLYGPADLVTQGHLPAELIAGSRQFLRPMVGVQPKGGHYLHFLAFEIGRSPDGSWFVLGDRTQATSGAGFALENRMATGRAFPERFPRAYIHRHAGFFGAFLQASERLAEDREHLRATPAILTPGPSNEAYYEHTYIARYLGIPLLEGEDIVVEDGRAKVRTISGPQPLGALWRRIDAGFADPIELDETSQIGTPGLMEAIRQGHLGMANALGSGILEMRAMLAFLPRICEVLTGKPLTLPNIATWWCGAADARAYVNANAKRMMIGSAYAVNLPFDLNATTALGGQFRGSARESVTKWLEEEGRSLVGQEAVTLSTTPAWSRNAAGEAQITPRPMTVRVFAARTETGWRFLHGGYARIGRSEDPTALAMQRGGSVADVWIVADHPVSQESLAPEKTGRFLRSDPGILPARAADNLYWLGRYIERTEDAIRLLRAYHLRLAATGNSADPRLKLMRSYLASVGYTFEKAIPDTLLGRLEMAQGCAAKVRDRFSTDGWNALGDLLSTARRLQKTAKPGDDAARAMSVFLRKITGFSGLVHENMYRFSAWHFLSFGRALERADATTTLLELYAAPDSPEGGLDLAVEVCDSVITHQRRFRVETSRDTVLDLLALDGDNPRALAFLMTRMCDLARRMPHAMDHGRPNALMRALMQLETEFSCAEPDDLTPERLRHLRHELGQVSDLLTTAYLR
ncbi:circularly permuted type 2 ATP-grasp protein [Thioclava sp. GXIMD4215]|uniref:circularly permuted type 2 ATP-grasp protein n=1 Tax=Thioclava sp. GXIMD4215 TaxID=3131928 RepID=UPI003243A42F